jgi:L-threonylcarbamoyladenylate synthase
MGTRRRRVSVKQSRSKLLKWDDLLMEIISNCTQDVIKMAARALKDGHLVAFPTETVYGLGADATNEKAVSRIYSVKGRPTDHPLIVHISSANKLDKWAVDIPEFAVKLAKKFWPGPMTLILKKSDLAKDFITGNQNTVGLRVPDQFITLAILREFEKLDGLGIAAPSANRFGAVSPTTANAVVEELGNFLNYKDLILGGGKSAIGVESSIIDCTNDYPIVLRPGAVTTEMVEKITGLKIPLDFKKSKIRTSGLLESHYSPNAKVVISKTAEPGEGFIALANIPTPPGVIRLGSPKNVEEYARIFYEALRMGDQKGLKKIKVVQPDGDGLAMAIRDRLGKSAAVKDLSDRG